MHCTSTILVRIPLTSKWSNLFSYNSRKRRKIRIKRWRWNHFPASFLFSFFNTVDFKQMFNINFANYWIRTRDLWCQKWPLCQLSHNQCPKLAPTLCTINWWVWDFFALKFLNSSLNTYFRSVIKYSVEFLSQKSCPWYILLILFNTHLANTFPTNNFGVCEAKHSVEFLPQKHVQWICFFLT